MGLQAGQVSTGEQTAETTPTTSQEAITATETPEQGNVSRETVEKKETTTKQYLDEKDYVIQNPEKSGEVTREQLDKVDKLFNELEQTKTMYDSRVKLKYWNGTDGTLNIELGLYDNDNKKMVNTTRYSIKKDGSITDVIDDGTVEYKYNKYLMDNYSPVSIHSPIYNKISQKATPTVSKTETVAEAKTPEATDTDFIEKSIPLVQKNADQLSEYADMLKKNPTMFGGLVQPDSKLGKAFSDFLDVKIKKYKRMLEQMKSKKMTKSSIAEVKKLVEAKESIKTLKAEFNETMKSLKSDMKSELKKDIEAIKYLDEQEQELALDKLQRKYWDKVDDLNKKISAEKYKAFWQGVLSRQDITEAIEKTRQEIRDRIKKSAEAKKERDDLSAKKTKLLESLKDMVKLYPEEQAMANELKELFDLTAKSMTLNKTIRLEATKKWFERYKKQMYKDGRANGLSEEEVEAQIEFKLPDKLLKELERLEKVQIKNMTAEQVQIVQEAIDNIMQMNKLKGMLIGRQYMREMSEALKDARKGINADQDAETARIIKGLENLVRFALTNDALNPKTMALKTIGWDEKNLFFKYLYENLDAGQNDKYKFEQDAFNLLDEAIKKLEDKKASEERVEVVLPDHTLKLNSFEKISLYLHSLNKQNIKHLLKGGARTKFTTKNGKVKLNLQNTKFTKDDILAIRKILTAEEMALAEKIQTFFDDMSKKAINKVSVKLLGYELARVKKYFPIITDNLFNNTNFPALYRKLLLESQGFLQERVGGANAILIEDVRDVLNRSVSAVGSYVGFAVPIRDAKLIMGNQEIKRDIINKFGNNAYKYYTKLFEQLENNNEEYDTLEKTMMNALSRVQQSILGLNIWILSKQPISFLSAQAELHVKDMGMSELGKNDWELIYKYSPMIWKRSRGFVTREAGELTTRLGRVHKTFDWTTSPITFVDRMTIGAIWKQVEREIQRTHPSLTKGSDEYYQAVARRTEQVVKDTQANYGLMQRSAVGRSQKLFTKTLTMFTSEANAQYNVLYRSLATMKKNPRKAFKGLLAVGMANMAVALVNFIRDRWRKKDEKKAWQYLAESSFGMVYLLGDFYSAITSGYGFENTGVSAIKDVITKGIDMFSPAKTKNRVGLALDFMVSTAHLFGVPVKNLKKELETIMERATPDWYNAYMESQLTAGVMYTFNKKKLDLYKKQQEYEIAKGIDNAKEKYTGDMLDRAVDVLEKEFKAVAGNTYDSDTVYDTAYSYRYKERYVAGYETLKSVYAQISDIRSEINDIEDDPKYTESEKKKLIKEKTEEYEALARKALNSD
jgi:hypothetical protein